MAIGVLVIFAPLTWVRKIQRFRFAFMFGVAMILVTIITISAFCFIFIGQRDWAKPSSGYYGINHDRFWDMIGFSFFMFEGIGCVMPVMHACDDTARSRFPYLIFFALSSLCLLYIGFSEICYYTFGDNLNQSIVMQEMPSDNIIIIIVKFLFCINILFSYPITIYPTNVIIDSFLFGGRKMRVLE